MWILGHHTRSNIKPFAFMIKIRFEIIPHYGLYRETDPRWNQFHRIRYCTVAHSAEPYHEPVALGTDPESTLWATVGAKSLL